MKRLRILATCLSAALVLAALSGCRKETPEGTPEEWLDDAQALHDQGMYYQEARENAPLGALEYYMLCLQHGRYDEPTTREIRHMIDWLSALKLVLAEGGQNKADYPEAIRAMTAFRENWPGSPNRGLALFYRALAKEYDVDYQDTAGAIEDYRQFVDECRSDEATRDSPLIPEARVRIGHCYEFNLDQPDYPDAIEVYDAVIKEYGPTNDALRQVPLQTRMCVERALYCKARILEDRLAPAAQADEALRCYAQAAEAYQRLTDPVFFGSVRFKQAQFVNYRYGCLLAEKLGRKDEGLAVLQSMADRWRESPWYGRVKFKMEQIEGKVDMSPGAGAADGGAAADDRRANPDAAP